MKIYTKTGDNGTTSLADGRRVPKHHIRLEAYGTVDELNSYIGLLRSGEVDGRIKESIIRIQNNLFGLGAMLATENAEKLKITPVDNTEIEFLESEIDAMNEDLPALRYFVLPGGNSIVSFCHIARTVCRRAERLCISLAEECDIDSNNIVYLNRLSDYLFVLSRKLVYSSGVEELPWQPPKK